MYERTASPTVQHEPSDALPEPKKGEAAEIWAIGGGKGGTGKSFLISSIAALLAREGKRVVLVDADLGGANLHTFLGVNRTGATLTDFFDGRLSLDAILVQSSIDNLVLLPGALRSLAPESIKHTQKLKFHRQLRKLEADCVLIDLGAGTHFNTIDTFLLAHKMIVVTAPEIIAIENLYYFLKNVFFRKLSNALATYGMRQSLQDTWRTRTDHNITTLRQLIDHLRALSPDMNDLIGQELDRFTVHLILNKVRNRQDIAMGDSIKSICLKYFGLKAKYVGFVERDDAISPCINKRHPYVLTYPSSRCSEEIERVTQNLREGKTVHG